MRGGGREGEREREREEVGRERERERERERRERERERLTSWEYIRHTGWSARKDQLPWRPQDLYYQKEDTLYPLLMEGPGHHQLVTNDP